MNLKPTHYFLKSQSIRRSAAVGVLLLCLASPLRAADPYLAPGHPDGIALLPPPPAPGSEEQAADLEEARTVFKGRTPAQEARALKDASLTFDLFAPAIGPDFDLPRLPRTGALLQEVKTEIKGIIDLPKNHWKRERPCQFDESLSLGKPEKGYSYPSGHSSWGTIYALILAELFPDKQEAILAKGRDLGWDRVLIGKHFPTDVQAGRVLGKAIFRELMDSPSFQHDLAEAKAEIASASLPRQLLSQPAHVEPVSAH
jgi:acid phosphatase (class A)